MSNTVYSTDTDYYRLFEKSESSVYQRRSINGNMVGCNKCFGYCRFSGHPGFLTKKQMQEHGCIEKECFHLVKKMPKSRTKKNNTFDLSDITESIQSAISEYVGIRVLKIEKQSDNEYKAYYITITNDYSLDKCIVEFQRMYHATIRFSRLNYDFDRCAKLICEM